MRSGQVQYINPQRGLIAIFTEDDLFTIAEFVGGIEPELYDEIAWKDDYSTGSTHCHNRTKNEQGELYFQDHGVRNDGLRNALLL